MKGGDISNVSSMQAIVTTRVVVKLLEEESGGIFRRSKSFKIGDIDLLACNKLWILSNNYALSLELAGFEKEDWNEQLLDKAFEKLERRVVNPFNYHELYESEDELIATLPYRPNLKAVIDIPEKVARYGSYGVQIDNL